MSLARFPLRRARTVLTHIGYETRGLHASSRRAKISNFQMPAMSPTMTEGGIANWKLKEGDKYSAGDVLLEIETDKATIDVEAQEDGVMGKIIAGDGTKNVPVGKVVALLAEEGDDISNLEPPQEAEFSSMSSDNLPSAPKASTSKEPSPPPPPKSTSHHSIRIDPATPIFPSVMRLLQENGVSPDKVKGTGRRGMLTKGDVLAFIGQASGPTGTWKEVKESPIPQKTVTEVKPQALDGPALRRLILEGLVDVSKKNQLQIPSVTASFDAIVADYLPPRSRISSQQSQPLPLPKEPARGYLDGLVA